MLFNVAQLLREPNGAERIYQVEAEIAEVAPQMPPAHVGGTVRLVRTNRGLLAYTALDGVTYVECGRCLGVAAIPVRLDLREEFLPTVDVHTGAALATAIDEGSFAIDDHHHVDMTEPIRQALVLQEPMRPLCREACAGLCDTCGADLNDGGCACSAALDSRWSTLSALADRE